MLKNIRLHIEKDEEKQAVLDQSLAKLILETQHNNINAFQRNIPSILPFIESVNLTSHSLFCNKFGEVNIVDYGLGRVLYGFDPKEEVCRQVEFAEQHCLVTKLKDATASKRDIATEQSNDLDYTKLPAYCLREMQKGLPAELDCLVVLGCGLGLHLEQLLTNHKINYLIIYEPQLQYFQCSTMSVDWVSIFEAAKKNGTAIFLQLKKDGRDLVSDISELNENFPLSEFYLYKHYNHDVFDSIELALNTRSWEDIVQNGFSIYTNKNYTEYVPQWTVNLDLELHASVEANDSRLSRNLSAFEKYFPAIYAQFKDYSPKSWLPIKNSDDQVNLLNKDSLSSWYGDSPKSDCDLNFENFNSQPNKDGLVLGYSGTKLAHYLHYEFVKETESLLKQAEEEVGELPESVASIIMFGLGSGYQLERLLDSHTVEKLFICEPNSDFFYASLFAIDWENIFAKVDDSKARIYLNIGDDGSNLFRDLLSQFHSIGPYILNNTYFYQSYYNSSLNTAIAQLREQLQVVISMGEYFDHAYYGIEHTKEGFRKNLPVLTRDPSKKLSFEDKEVPVFVVGNGPSLDLSIEAIKEWQEQAIIISCGTALQAMHRHGITPDFHAEIEQNRSTFDWAVLTGDLDYLKNITLISCNGIHPDTCELYKDVLIAFKEGESSSVSALTVLGEDKFETLKHAFPTVSNFVCDLTSVIGFNHIYLMGVDLGFVDVKHHHSKSSGYYDEDGEEVYDYTKVNNTSLVVPGNFRPTVNTKHEFKISKQTIEQVTLNKLQYQTFYNCSDGAKILGTNPLRIEDLLIVSDSAQKLLTIKRLKSVVYSTHKNQDFIEKYENRFSHSLLENELSEMQQLLDQEVSTKEQANFIINKQKEMLFSSYKKQKSLLFYYLYGTVNYANAILTKLQISQNEQVTEPFSQCLDKWGNKFTEITNLLSLNTNQFDTSTFRRHQREVAFSRLHEIPRTLLVVTNSMTFFRAVKRCKGVLTSAGISDVFFCDVATAEAMHTEGFDFVIYYLPEHDDSSNVELFSADNKNALAIGKESSLYIVNRPIHSIRSLDNIAAGLTLMPIDTDHFSADTTVLANPFYIARSALHICFAKHQADMVLLKFTVKENSSYSNSLLDIDQLRESDSIYDFYCNYYPVYFASDTRSKLISSKGTRGKLVLQPYPEELLIESVLDEHNFESTVESHEKILTNMYEDAPYVGQEHLVVETKPTST